LTVAPSAQSWRRAWQQCGMSLPVIDLTHLITNFKDMLAPSSPSVATSAQVLRRLRTCSGHAETRLSSCSCATTMACNEHAAAPPFLVVRPGAGNGILVPPGGGKAFDEAYMLRFCLSCLCPTFNCPVCLDDKPTSGGGEMLDSNGFTINAPNSFPCGHLICRPCTRQLMPFRVRGVTCPVCREVSPTWTVDDDGFGGGKLVECP